MRFGQATVAMVLGLALIFTSNQMYQAVTIKMTPSTKYDNAKSGAAVGGAAGLFAGLVFGGIGIASAPFTFGLGPVAMGALGAAVGATAGAATGEGDRMESAPLYPGWQPASVLLGGVFLLLSGAAAFWREWYGAKLVSANGEANALPRPMPIVIAVPASVRGGQQVAEDRRPLLLTPTTGSADARQEFPAVLDVHVVQEDRVGQQATESPQPLFPSPAAGPRCRHCGSSSLMKTPGTKGFVESMLAIGLILLVGPFMAVVVGAIAEVTFGTSLIMYVAELVAFLCPVLAYFRSLERRPCCVKCERRV